MAVLDTSGLWTAGDDYRVIKALGVPFGSYTLSCTAGCMNDLQSMSTVAQQDVLDLLTAYETAEAAQIAANLADTEGKTLVKADVLEWEPDGADQPSGPQQEMLRCRMELGTTFAFCSCLAGLLGGSGAYSTALIRS